VEVASVVLAVVTDEAGESTAAAGSMIELASET
jgi:hypothetical protein